MPCFLASSWHVCWKYLLYIVPFFPVDFGVDYLIDSYGRLLEIARAALKIKLNLEQNLLALEMLYNLFTVYTNQLRENPNSFYTLVRTLITSYLLLLLLLLQLLKLLLLLQVVVVSIFFHNLYWCCYCVVTNVIMIAVVLLVPILLQVLKPLQMSEWLQSVLLIFS